jgi:hypothetical protein
MSERQSQQRRRAGLSGLVQRPSRNQRQLTLGEDAQALAVRQVPVDPAVHLLLVDMRQHLVRLGARLQGKGQRPTARGARQHPFTMDVASRILKQAKSPYLSDLLPNLVGR